MLDERLTCAGLIAGAVLLIPLSGGCGDSTQEVKTVTVETQVTVEQSPAPRRQRQNPRPRAASSMQASDEFVNCDPNIHAKADTTTCPFAENVFWTYWTSGESTGPLQVWSPAGQASFATRCHSDGAQVVCTTRDNAAVRFSQDAVDRYSQTQADTYASGHDLGPDPYEGLPPTGIEPTAGEGDMDGGYGDGEDCQGYDPCIPSGSDVDCAAGEGNGPRYVDGPVYVNGYDPYDLDRDGDGVGCDT